jgi:UDP-2,3-diacylglucosamine hydrolase
MPNHTLFISDLHLEPAHPEMVQLFLNFLEQQAPQADALYILGDFFEVWIGDDDDNAFIQQIRRALRALTQKIPVYFMVGNRDFLLGERFAKATGCQLIEDPTLINLYGTSTLLLHGDSLCTFDKHHQKFRKISRNSRYQKIFLTLPLFLRRQIAKWLRGLSKKHNQTAHNYQLNVNPTEVNHFLKEFHTSQMIHGHTHQPNIHSIEIDGKICKRIVLGAWHNQGNALRVDNNNNIELITF